MGLGQHLGTEEVGVERISGVVGWRPRTVLAGLIACGVQAGLAQEPFPPVDRDVYRVVNSVAFSPSGDEIYFAVLYHSFLERRGPLPDDAPVTAMFSVRRVDGSWVMPELLPFSGTRRTPRSVFPNCLTKREGSPG